MSRYSFLRVMEVRKHEYDLIERSLKKAADALGSVLNSSIEVQKIVVGNPKIVDGLPIFYESDLREINLFRTKLLGDLKGLCYLIFPTEEIRRIQEKCLPMIDGNAEDDMNIKDGFLLEIDNIISGTVISMFSNELKATMYGDVPSLHRMMMPAVNEYLNDESLRFEHVINFKAVFKGDELEIAPEFIWMVDGKFLTTINDILQQKFNF